MADLTGQRLSQYLILERISKGATSTVYKAYQEKLDRYVAVKVLSPHFIDEDGFLERFKQEARAVAQLDHPNILPVYDFDQIGDIMYIVMKYVDTGTLKEQMGLPLDLRLTLEIVTQVGLALGYAHRQGVIHRDVKPGNILLGEGNWALLTDFGLAKIRAGDRKLTKSGIGMGTPDYMSPEQAQGLPVDGRSDLYSLGCTLHEMLTGRVPFEADSGMAVVVKHITEPPRPPREINPKLPLAVEQVILRSLEKDANRRYQTAEQMVADLARAVGTPNQFLLPGERSMPPLALAPAAKPHTQAQPASVRVAQARDRSVDLAQKTAVHARRAGTWLWIQLGRVGRAIREALARLGRWLRRAAAAIAALIRRAIERTRAVFSERMAVRTATRAAARTATPASGKRARTSTTRVLKKSPAVKGRGKSTAAQPTVPALTARMQQAAETVRAMRARVDARRAVAVIAIILVLLLLVLLIFNANADGAPAFAQPTSIATATGPASSKATRSAETRSAPGLASTAQPPPAASLSDAPAGMVTVPGGTFKMGATTGSFDPDETPPHWVTLDPFYIDAVEVTVAQFASFVNDSGYVTDAEKKGDATTWRTYNAPDRQRHPATVISWNDAVAFCRWVGKRLPTEAEWELAAKGYTENIYTWGNSFSRDLANTAERGVGQPMPVASMNAVSPFGAYDMIGNVWEWVSDWYGGNYYALSSSENPQGPGSGLQRVIRGGSFKSNGDRATTTIRRRASVDGWSDDIGFRCVRDVP
ncbi:MAG TPA: SUMF1/EgtB/PvdO family nonheme iron enzyme [Anaerolineae bacterium]